MAGLGAISGQDGMLGTLIRVISSAKQVLDVVVLEMGRMVAESVMLIEREELAGPDYYPTNPDLQKWAHKEGSIFIGDQKVKVTRPLLGVDVSGQKLARDFGRTPLRIRRSASHCSPIWNAAGTVQGETPASTLRDS